jgi:hypothetical protein
MKEQVRNELLPMLFLSWQFSPEPLVVITTYGKWVFEMRVHKPILEDRNEKKRISGLVSTPNVRFLLSHHGRNYVVQQVTYDLGGWNREASL